MYGAIALCLYLYNNMFIIYIIFEEFEVAGFLFAAENHIFLRIRIVREKKQILLVQLFLFRPQVARAEINRSDNNTDRFTSNPVGIIVK